MSNLSRKIIVILFAILPIVFIFICGRANLGALVGGSSNLKNFIFSMVYIFVWLTTLAAGILLDSKGLVKYFTVFWIIELVYMTLITFASETILGFPFFITMPIFYMPIVGICYVSDIYFSIWIFDFFTIPFICTSLIMVVIGRFALQKFKCNT